MILVNSPGNSVAYPLLEHAAWNGCTLADLVFPFFIIIVGTSSVLAITGLKTKGVSNQQLFKKILFRSVYIFILGILLNAFPSHFNLYTVRLLGVLQRIACCYFVCSLLILTTTLRTQIGIFVVLLVSYACLMTYFSPPPITVNHNWVGYVDQLVFSPFHLYTPTFDPEGLLSTLPAIGSALLGNFLGFCLISSKTPQQKCQWMIIAGLVLISLGWIWSYTLPFNKSLWSSSYVLWTGGLAFLTFALCYIRIEIKGHSYWPNSFYLFGKNALLVFILHVVFLKIQAMIMIHNSQGEWMNLRHYITYNLFSYLAPENASLCYAIAYVLFWLLILKLLEKWRHMSRAT